MPNNNSMDGRRNVHCVAMRPLFASLSDERAQIYALILASADIPYKSYRYKGLWAITVGTKHRSSAIMAISQYLTENPIRTSTALVAGVSGTKTYSAVYILPFLVLIHWAVMPGYEHKVFVDTFGADSERILAGEVYRSITALLLHKDWSHVINNLVGMALFGTVAASMCGWGMGWFLILLSGAAGNMATAMWYQQEHMAIGASTAVFGALGLCVALNLWRHVRSAQPSWPIWLPLAGGLALLGFIGSSPHSDLMAHLSGFGLGIVIGGGYGLFFRQAPDFKVQLVTAILGVGLIILSWIVGIYSGG